MRAKPWEQHADSIPVGGVGLTEVGEQHAFFGAHVDQVGGEDVKDRDGENHQAGKRDAERDPRPVEPRVSPTALDGGPAITLA